MNRIYFPLVLGFLFISCKSRSQDRFQTAHSSETTTAGETKINTVNDIPLPIGFQRGNNGDSSFSGFLQRIRIKDDKTVYLYNGEKKLNQSAQFAVLDVSVGNQNLQQCADAVMRLRAEYLFATGQFNEIAFTDNGGKVYKFSKPYDREHLSNFMNTVFSMCGSVSLSKQLYAKSFRSILPGDVIIRGGFPGHAVIVLDVAINKERKKIFLLAQSYMPAQDIHILRNPANSDLSPWYEVDIEGDIETPEYIFKRTELKAWEWQPNESLYL